MASNTFTAILIAGAGALSKFVLDRDFSWKAAGLSAVGTVGGYFVAMAIIELVPYFSTASDTTRYAVVYLGGVLFPSLIKRIGNARIKANFGIVEIDSKGDEK